MEHVGRALQEGADRGPLFFEERTDVRMFLGSGRALAVMGVRAPDERILV